jgi:hypothetical protein
MQILISRFNKTRKCLIMGSNILTLLEVFKTGGENDTTTNTLSNNYEYVADIFHACQFSNTSFNNSSI